MDNVKIASELLRMAKELTGASEVVDDFFAEGGKDYNSPHGYELAKMIAKKAGLDLKAQKNRDSSVTFYVSGSQGEIVFDGHLTEKGLVMSVDKDGRVIESNRSFRLRDGVGDIVKWVKSVMENA